MYIVYDLCVYIYRKKYLLFYGWGIHLFTGRFGAGKTSLMVIKAYELAEKYPQLHIVTNLHLLIQEYFPERSIYLVPY